MPGKLKIKIKESEKQLVQLLRQEKESLAKERIQILYWLKTGQAETVNNLATLIGRHRTTVSRWLRDYRLNGIDNLVKIGKSSGRKNKLEGEIIYQIERELKEPEGFKSYSEIVRWLNAVHDQEVSYTVVYKLVHYKLKAKLKVPRPVHIKQQKGAVESLKKKLPELIEENLAKNL